MRFYRYPQDKASVSKSERRKLTVYQMWYLIKKALNDLRCFSVLVESNSTLMLKTKLTKLVFSVLKIALLENMSSKQLCFTCGLIIQLGRRGLLRGRSASFWLAELSPNTPYNRSTEARGYCGGSWIEL